MRAPAQGIAHRQRVRVAAQLATAQDEGPPVPVEKAAYHWPIFSNEYVMLLRVLHGSRQGLELPHPLARSDHRAGPSRRQCRPGVRQGARGAEGGHPRQCRLHRLFQEAVHPPLDQHRRYTVQQHRHCAAQAGPRHLHAAGARCSGLPATVRQRAGARLAAPA